jgi:predicted enzyme related to lactoylglutathione lyase
MPDSSPLRGYATISFWADDLEAAKRWYTEFLGIAPYFDRPGYVEWRIGDFQAELGIIDRQYAPAGWPTEPAGAIMHWHVDNVEATLERLVSLGAKLHQPPIDRGEGFVTATVIDPFGNVLGFMYNPHYVDVLARVNPQL